MSGHPAPDELLLDYAVGALPEGPALAVAAHVALDPASRRMVDALAAAGGALLDGEAATSLEERTLDDVLGRLDKVPVEPGPQRNLRPVGPDWAPLPLRPYLSQGASWKRVFGGFEEIRIGLQSDTHRVSLLRLQPGQGLPVHRHVAAEYTVVLQGGYSDGRGSYSVGDFALGSGETEHEPVADPGEPCIALIVLEEPIVLTGRWGRWINPLLRRGWI
ncbi:anti-ECFsigma factor, ChrR [Enhydrobacter aerosaccus]|uniref:Anti-ECFsigma factor, ChrR n=1 Tax=Enhydrobacter aerosaccus TaxID=225324 RepID=A0A1T4S0K9_9HYPH|nr:ChrR family anti-sigma-E factor [Enhydrobacter aerosaccus]SKA21745.1 anti-ECFsigma factor, ChrR [Enhydrobacter aerosaccus]